MRIVCQYGSFRGGDPADLGRNNVDINLASLRAAALACIACFGLLSSGITDFWASHPRGRSPRPSPNHRAPCPAEAASAGSGGREQRQAPAASGARSRSRPNSSESGLRCADLETNRGPPRSSDVWRMLSMFYSCVLPCTAAAPGASTSGERAELDLRRRWSPPAAGGALPCARAPSCATLKLKQGGLAGWRARGQRPTLERALAG